MMSLSVLGGDALATVCGSVPVVAERDQGQGASFIAQSKVPAADSRTLPESLAALY